MGPGARAVQSTSLRSAWRETSARLADAPVAPLAASIETPSSTAFAASTLCTPPGGIAAVVQHRAASGAITIACASPEMSKKPGR